jgi:SAM-dependent methyltransferase
LRLTDTMLESERLIALARRLPPIVPQVGLRVLRAATTPAGALRYLHDRRTYRGLPNAEPLRWRDALPQLGDRIATSPFDRHYFFQDLWAARHIASLTPKQHIDVGSRVDYVGFLTAICDVVFVDIRPLAAEVDRLQSIAGSVLELPFPDRFATSLSCLHVAEHIGLGRYGDPLNPLGTRHAAAELQRVLAPGGQLLFSVPVGRPRVCFNAHRIHAPHEVVAMFDELELAEFSGVGDDGIFRRECELGELAGARYACGMYRFKRHTGEPA